MKNSATTAATRPKTQPADHRNKDMGPNPGHPSRRVKPLRQNNATHLQENSPASSPPNNASHIQKNRCPPPRLLVAISILLATATANFARDIRIFVSNTANASQHNPASNRHTATTRDGAAAPVGTRGSRIRFGKKDFASKFQRGP
jgi:hypothetical protein